jgi:phenylpropionate dioxygenase-like ring-hydroxylating dioxygenase large terminal subunit
MLISQVPALRDYWYAVAYGKDVADKPISVRLFDQRYVLWRAGPGASVSAAVDECPHRSGPLSQGWVQNGCLVCPYHGWRYAADGRCVEIPQNEPDQPISPRARARTVKADERYGLVWICVGTPRAGIPVLPEAEDSKFTLIHELMEVWKSSAPRIIDNALDVSHLCFVHRNTVGEAALPRLSEFTVSRDGDTLEFSVSYNVKMTLQAAAGAAGDQLTTRTTHAYLVQPMVFRGVLVYPDGLTHVLYKTVAPVSDTESLFCQFIARNDAPTAARQAQIAELDRKVQSEDRTLLEAIDPDYPIEPGREIHLKVDRMTVEYRRILADLAKQSVAAE